MSFLTPKHAKYFQLCMNSLPQRAESEDANKIAIVYFVLTGLDLINSLDLENRNLYAEYIYSHLILGHDTSVQGFRASPTFKLDPGSNSYDLPNLSATLFALSCLLALEEDFSARLDRHKIMKFVAQCQVQEGPDKGSFRPILGADGTAWGESDLRLCYIATCIRKMVGYDKLAPHERVCDIKVDALVAFIELKVNYDGGLALFTLAESNAGLTYCALAALTLVGRKVTDMENWALTQNWLAHRQIGEYPNVDLDTEYEQSEGDIGGFNGRDNKPADTCYAWWLLAPLAISGSTSLVDTERAVKHLFTCQNKLVGGFGKKPGAMPDPYHLFLGVATVALLKAAGSHVEGGQLLQDVDAELVISKRLREFMERMWSTT